MNVYFFTSDFEIIKELELSGFDGVLHTYNANNLNAFINIAKNISDETKMKHMVAIRPYTVSPQFLFQIDKAFNELYKKNILQINFICGWIKESEKDVKGIVGSVNDYSTSIERSNYLIEYIDVLENSNNQSIDYYISVTNQFTFDSAVKNNSKIIIDYSHFKAKLYDIKDKKVMVGLNGADKDGVLFSQEDLLKILLELESSGIEGVFFGSGERNVIDHVIELVKKYKKRDFSSHLLEDCGKLDT